MRQALARRLAGASAAGVAVAAAAHRCLAEDNGRFSGLPAHLKGQQFVPNTPYPDWDTDWDHRKFTVANVAAALGIACPSSPSALAHAIRKAYAEPGPSQRSAKMVDAMIEEHAADLDGLLVRAGTAARGVNRHLILVRHGQYEEGHSDDSLQILTPLGRQQAEATGKRIAEFLASPNPAAPARFVRVHCSTMARARETADIIAAQLPEGGFERLEADPLLVEGAPPAHNLPSPMYDPVHVHTSLMEAAFRSLFHRLPLATAPASPDAPRPQQYDVIVCHANVIRYTTLRALQLPPEAWFRCHPKNCSITHLRLRADGEVDLFAYGDAGHLSIDDNTFGMARRYPFG